MDPIRDIAAAAAAAACTPVPYIQRVWIPIPKQNNLSLSSPPFDKIDTRYKATLQKDKKNLTSIHNP
jgi:hypothetical protein